MVAFLAVLAVAPWAHPLAFLPAHGWQKGASGTTHSLYVGHKKWASEPLESAAWLATGVRYADPATADPPNTTLARLPKDAVIIWAVISSPIVREKPITLAFGKATRYACCEAARIPAEYDITGSGARNAYSVIVRIYFGSRPTARLRREAALALRHLELPPAR